MKFTITATHGDARAAELTVNKKKIDTPAFHDHWHIWFSEVPRC